MPAKSKQQLKLIWIIRNKYGTKKNAPKKWKWVFEEEWGHLAKESHIFNFKQFNEAMGTLSNDDNEMIEDLALEFSEKWKLSFKTHEDYCGYISLQRFDKFHIQFGIQLNCRFNWTKSGNEFSDELNKLIERIEKFGYDVMRISWNISPLGIFRTFTFQISHTEEKSKEILNK